jgi:GDP-mannose 6-dehydrogenase
MYVISIAHNWRDRQSPAVHACRNHNKGGTMNIGVFGLGYVGSVTAACLASRGHRVVGVDSNIAKVDAINGGHSAIIEPGLEELIREGARSGNLRATHDACEASAHADILIICVGTPSDANGNLVFTFLDRVCLDIAEALRAMSGFKVIAVRSTLLPGTIAQRVVPLLTRGSGKRSGEDFGVASNPEFLREGSAIDDFNRPPFTIVGALDQRARDMLEQLYRDIPAPIFHTDVDTASMIKYASNAFHALKVVFANEIGLLCKKADVDGTQVMDIFCRDNSLNISSKYLKPGFAFGGSCLPKDLRALLYLARHGDLELPMLESLLPSNRLHIQRIADLVLSSPGRRKVGVIGLTFKPGTDDLRESPIVHLVEVLNGKGVEVKIFDRNVLLSRLIGGNKAFIEQALPHIAAMMRGSMEEVVQDADAVVVGHALEDGGMHLVSLLGPNQLLIDLVRMAPGASHSATYEGVCW